MRIEVMVGNADPQIYPLQKSRVLIGSSESCDIIIHTDEVSRKHLIIGCEDEKYYVIDQGSTNGTYINEQRLVPGRRSEFTSFFPIRLGSSVLISLLSDEEAIDLGFSEMDFLPPPPAPTAKIPEKAESTMMLSLKDLQNTKTEKLIKRRKEVTDKKKAQPTKSTAKNADKTRMLLIKILSVLLVGAAFYYSYFLNDQAPPPVAVVGQITPVKPPKKLAPDPSRLIADEDLMSRSKISHKLSNDIKCTNDLEQYLCRSIQGAGASGWGVVQTGTMFTIMLDGTHLFHQARSSLRPLPPEREAERDSFEKAINLLAVALFIQQSVPEHFDDKLFTDNRLTFSFFMMTPEGPQLRTAMAITPAALKELKSRLNAEHIKVASAGGYHVINFMYEYLKLY
jgi:pSer/pThr/pTyr-binding forkhead associated (FHA) protein